MKTALVFFLLLWCALLVLAQSDSSDSSRCLPRKPGPFPVLREGRPETDEYLYPRYFRYVKQWDECFAGGQWPASTVEQFPHAYPDGMKEEQRKIVTLTASDWEPEPREGTWRVAGPGAEMGARPGEVTTWAEMQEAMQQRWRDATETEERAKLVASGLEKLKLRLGAASFRMLDDYVHELYHAIPGRLVRQALPETAMYSRYLHTIAMMDKFAAKGGDDGQAAAEARAEEQAACGLSDKEEAILQKVAEDFQEELSENRPATVPSDAAGGMGRPATAAVGRPTRLGLRGERNRIIDAHIEQLRSGLGEAGFEKVENRLRVMYQFDGMLRVVPIDTPEAQGKAGEPVKAVP
jgi:hypothetical protein